jgi:hypothetical protein
MIEIIRGAETKPGIWEYSVPSLGLCGKSRQPLLDACRQIKRAGGGTAQCAGLFRDGMDTPDISCPVEAGAALTVEETSHGSPRFRKFKPYPGRG